VKFKVSVNVKDRAKENNYYKWDWYNVKQINWCREYTIGSAAGTLSYVDPCCETCYQISPCIDCIELAQDKLIDGNVFNKPITTIPFDDNTNYYLVVNQYSISENAYKFWNAVKEQSKNSGGLFDAIPKSIKGNFKNAKDPKEEVLGYFTVSDVHEEIIIIAPRKELSGTYQNSLLAQEMIERDKERIHVVEVNNVAMCETICTERAIALIHQGSEVQYILEEIKSLSSSVITYAFPGSLKYLKLSGRVSGTSAIIGEMLNMRTAVKVTDEFVKIDHKGRGEKSCLKYLNNQIKLYQPKRACVSDIKADVEFLESVVALVESHGIEVYFTEEADIVTGTHFGPSSLGIAFY
jgi:DegV family protein with EDD domain